MTQETEFEFVQPTSFDGIGCSSIENLEIPSGGGAFLQLKDGPNQMRFLQGPIVSYVSQKWTDAGLPDGEKKRYAHNDPAAKKDPNAKLVITFLVFERAPGGAGSLKLFEISQRDILKAIKDINSMQPDMSAFDIKITKTPKAGTKFSDYTIVQGPPSPFGKNEVEQAAISEIKEKNILERIKTGNKEAEEFGDAAEQAEIDAQVEAKEKELKGASKTAAEEAQEVFE